MRKIKLHSTLSFEEEETDMYKVVQGLANEHRLTDMLNGLLRVYFMHPEKFEGINVEGFTDVDRLNSIAELRRLHESRHKEYNRKLDWLCKRLIELEDRLEGLYTADKMRTTIGLPERVRANYCAELLLKQELKDLSEKIGHPVDIDQSRDLETSSQRLLAYIIEHYPEAISELQQITAQSVAVASAAPVVVTTATRDKAGTLMEQSAVTREQAGEQAREQTGSEAHEEEMIQPELVEVKPAFEQVLGMFGTMFED